MDFEAIHAALLASERGRAFLAEYARRNRHADTAQVLAAIDRLVAAAQADVELRALADATPAKAHLGTVEPVREPVKQLGQEPPFDVERLRAELADMANAITRAKSEIAAMKAADRKRTAAVRMRLLNSTGPSGSARSPISSALPNRSRNWPGACASRGQMSVSAIGSNAARATSIVPARFRI